MQSQFRPSSFTLAAAARTAPACAMLSRTGAILGLSLAAIACIAFDAASAPPVRSTFDRDDEGWVVTDLSCSNYANVVGTYSVQWVAEGGNPGGSISKVDPSNQCFFFNAPAKFLGDQSSRIGGSLHFSVRTDLSNYLPGSVLVFIGNGGQVIVHDFPQPDADVWRTYLVPLHHDSFKFNTASGPAVSEAQFAAILTNLEAIRISGEFGSVIEETSDLDTVCLRSGDCLADLTCSGSVDVQDLLALLGAWGPCEVAGGCPADLNDSGAVDVQDLLILLGAWGPCPD